MKRIFVISLIVSALVLMFISACTPPPPEENIPDTNTSTETTDPAIATPTQEGTSEPVMTETGDGTTQTMTDPENEEAGETEEEAEDSETGEEAETETVEEEVVEETTSGDIPTDYFDKYDTWPPDAIDEEDIELLRHVIVVFETSKGIIKMRVFPDAAPLNSANFVKLALEGYYDSSPFHRVVTDFMSQGGTRPDLGDIGYTIPAEIGLPHKAGSVAAARQGDQINPQQRSSGDQFYLCRTTERTTGLDGAYTVYGEIVEGQEVNLALAVNNNGRQAIPGADTDIIIRAWIEVG